jgi:hypothetical protein
VLSWEGANREGMTFFIDGGGQLFGVGRQPPGGSEMHAGCRHGVSVKPKSQKFFEFRYIITCARGRAGLKICTEQFINASLLSPQARTLIFHRPAGRK